MLRRSHRHLWLRRGTYKMQKLWCCVPLALTFSMVFQPAAQAVEQLSVGDNVRVACQNMAVYAAPSAMGVPVSRLEFGTSLSVQSLNSPYLLPDSDYKSKKKLEQQAKNMAGEEGTPRTIKPSLIVPERATVRGPTRWPRFSWKRCPREPSIEIRPDRTSVHPA